jgi:predicted amidophosphoribosyltransferase
MPTRRWVRRIAETSVQWGRAAAAELIDIAVDRRCACCGQPHPTICPQCRAAWGRPFAAPAVLPGLPVVAATTYRAAGPAVIAFKERGRLTLEAPLAQALHTAVQPLLPPSICGPITLVPVPTWPAKARARGLDHSQALAARVAQVVSRDAGRPVGRANRLVRHVRAVADQSTLDEAGRQANLSGALRAVAVDAAGGQRGPLIVVDDVLTTGATVRETVRALGVAGWSVTGVAVVAAVTSPAARTASLRV